MVVVKFPQMPKTIGKVVGKFIDGAIGSLSNTLSSGRSAVVKPIKRVKREDDTHAHDSRVWDEVKGLGGMNAKADERARKYMEEHDITAEEVYAMRQDRHRVL